MYLILHRNAINFNFKPTLAHLLAPKTKSVQLKIVTLTTIKCFKSSGQHENSHNRFSKYKSVPRRQWSGSFPSCRATVVVDVIWTSLRVHPLFPACRKRFAVVRCCRCVGTGRAARRLREVGGGRSRRTTRSCSASPSSVGGCCRCCGRVVCTCCGARWSRGCSRP